MGTASDAERVALELVLRHGLVAGFVIGEYPSVTITPAHFDKAVEVIAAALREAPGPGTRPDVAKLVAEHCAQIAEEAKVPPGERLGDECCTEAYNAACDSIASAIRCCDHLGALEKARPTARGEVCPD